MGKSRDNQMKQKNDVSRCSLPWREATHRSERVGETTKAHQRHEGSLYSPWDITTQAILNHYRLILKVVTKPSQTQRG